MEGLWLGLGLGLAAGLSPGPLLTLVLTSTLQRGVGAGLRVASAPLVTDLPIVAVALFAAGQAPEHWFHGLSIFGGVFVLYLGWSTWREARDAELVPEATSSAAEARKDLWSGALVNVLSPHPWLFWLGLGGPQTVRLWRESGWWSAAAFLGLFYVALVGSKAILALVVAGGRHRLSDLWYRRILKICGLVLAALGIGLAVEGLRPLL